MKDTIIYNNTYGKTYILGLYYIHHKEHILFIYPIHTTIQDTKSLISNIYLFPIVLVTGKNPTLDTGNFSIFILYTKMLHRCQNNNIYLALPGDLLPQHGDLVGDLVEELERVSQLRALVHNTVQCVMFTEIDLI